MSAFTEAIHGNIPVLVDFYADWCEPCKMQAPILKNVAQNMGNKIRILKINVDKNPHVAAKYHVRNIPTLAIFKQGTIVWREAGVKQAGELQKILAQYI